MDLAEACNAYGIKLLSYGSLNGGFHSGKYLDGKKPEGARHTKNSKFQHRYTGPAVEEALKKYKVIADEKGLTLTQFVIAWCVTCHPLKHFPSLFCCVVLCMPSTYAVEHHTHWFLVSQDCYSTPAQDTYTLLTHLFLCKAQAPLLSSGTVQGF